MGKRIQAFVLFLPWKIIKGRFRGLFRESSRGMFRPWTSCDKMVEMFLKCERVLQFIALIPAACGMAFVDAVVSHVNP